MQQGAAGQSEQFLLRTRCRTAPRPGPAVLVARVAGQLLQHQARGALVVGGQQQARGQLLGLPEIVLERAGERIGFQRHQALVSRRFATCGARVLDGDRQDRVRGPSARRSRGNAASSSIWAMPRRVPAAVHSANSVRSAPSPRSCTDSRPSILAWPVNSAAAAVASPSSLAQRRAGYSRAFADLPPGGIQVHAHAAHAGVLEEETGQACRRQAVVVGLRACVDIGSWRARRSSWVVRRAHAR